MKLFLAAEAKHPDSLEKLTTLLGKDFKDIKITYIPTAANGELYGSWKSGESIQVAQSLGAQFKVVELEDQVYRNVISEITDSNVIWVAGGMTGYLLYWMRRVELDKALPEMLAKGTIYVGSSAGSMVCAKTQYAAEIFSADPEPGSGLVPGLGLIDFEIYPHYDEEMYDEIKCNWPKGTLYLLKNGEVITVVDGKVAVLGEKRVIEK